MFDHFLVEIFERSRITGSSEINTGINKIILNKFLLNESKSGKCLQSSFTTSIPRINLPIDEPKADSKSEFRIKRNKGTRRMKLSSIHSLYSP